MRRLDLRCGWALCLVVTGALVGCASTPKQAQPEETREQSAAALQVQLGQQYLINGDLEKAQDKLKRALELDPRSVDAHTLVAVLNERIGRPEIAETHHRKALAIKPDDGALNNNFGVFLCGQGRYAESRTYFDKATSDPFYKTPGAAFANAGVCARKSGDLTASETNFRRALDLDPRNTVALYELARVAHERGEYLRARAFIQRYEALAPPDAALLSLAADVESKLGDQAHAEKYRERLQRDFPDYADPGQATEPAPSKETSSS
ncbi:MAG: type IV pilus biogenesis/stability protein PilW [Xanthomonadales bacterium]|nr:type IV pilus biogenesis/stability protein PilW [Xanthomonadales bacterium]